MNSVEFYQANGWDTSVLFNHPFLDPKATVKENCDRHTKWVHELAPQATGVTGTRNWKEHPYYKDNNDEAQRKPFPHNISSSERIQSGKLAQSFGRPDGVMRCLTCIHFHRDCHEGPIRRGGKCATCQGSEGITMVCLKPTETPMHWSTDASGAERPVWRYRGQVREPYWPLLRYFINDYKVAKLFEGGRFVDKNNRSGIAARRRENEIQSAVQSEAEPSEATPVKRGRKRKNVDVVDYLDRPKKALRPANADSDVHKAPALVREITASNRIGLVRNPLRAVKYSNKEQIESLSNDEIELEYQKLAVAPAKLYLRGLLRAGMTAQAAINIACGDHRKALEIAAEPAGTQVDEERAQLEMRLSRVRYEDIVSTLHSWHSKPGIEVSRATALRFQAALNLSSSNKDLAMVYVLLDCSEVVEEVARLEKLAESSEGRIPGIDVWLDDFEKEIIISKLVTIPETQSRLCTKLMSRTGFDQGIDRIYEYKNSMPDFLWMQLDRAAVE